MTPSPGKYTFCHEVFKQHSADFSFFDVKFFSFLESLRFFIKIQHNSITILHLILFAREGILQQNPIKPTFALN